MKSVHFLISGLSVGGTKKDKTWRPSYGHINKLLRLNLLMRPSERECLGWKLWVGVLWMNSLSVQLMKSLA